MTNVFRVEVYDEEEASIWTAGIFTKESDAELTANLELQKLKGKGDVAVIQHQLDVKVPATESPYVIYSKAKQ